MKTWITSELSTSHFGDKRLSHRFMSLVEKLSESPSSSIPEAMQSTAATKAAYRFWDSEKTSAKKILSPHRASVLKRISELVRVLAIQDTSTVDYTGHPGVKDLGYLEKEYQRGIKLHALFAVSVEGLPLGVLDEKMWTRPLEEYGKKKQARQKPIVEKESYRWLEMVEFAHSQIGPQTEIVNIADCEGDIYELFTQKRPPHSQLLIRAHHNRCLMDEAGYLYTALQQSERCGNLSIMLRKKDGNPAREAHLELRHTSVQMKAPANKPASLQPVTMNAIEVWEPDAPPDVKPVRWLLLTTLPIDTVEDIKTYVFYYSLRWLIERFFYTLKSGCKIEELQLETAERLQKAIATYSIVAWRLMALIYQSRLTPHAPCDTMLQTYEWQTLYLLTYQNVPPNHPPTLQESVLWIAKLGGFLARKSDGNPGIRTLWRGYKRLQDAVQIYNLLNGNVKTTDMGKP